MSVEIQSPWPGAEQTIILPNPEFNDGENHAIAVATKRAKDGTLYSYVKTSGNKALNWHFNITLKKARELRNFLLAYYDAQWRVKDWEGQYWIVKLVVNPVEFTSRGREMVSNGRERQSVDLELEGYKV